MVAGITRPLDGVADLRRMQRLVQDAWALDGPKVERHVGDLAWSTFQHVGREPEWERQLWEEDGELVAYGWLFRPETLDYQLDPRRPELLDDVLTWFEQRAERRPLKTSALAEDLTARETLRRRGYVEVEDEPWFAYMLRDLEDVAEQAVPEGYSLRTVRGPDDVERRVEVHRAAFHPSRVTAESYRNVMAAWPYRAELDCVAEAPDASFAAYALAWYDDRNRVGELEPVGTHPEHRRLGLARAVNLFALRRLRETGAESAIVLCRGDSAYPGPKLFYESVGFRQHSRGILYRRS